MTAEVVSTQAGDERRPAASDVEEPPTRTVVITGADGPVAESVRRHLGRHDWAVTSLRRGDALDPLLGADAVVVLDAETGGVPSYVRALRAVAHSLRQVGVKPQVLAVSPWPIVEDQRDALLKRFEAADEEARAAGLDLRALRHGLLVGTPDEQGPIDSALFSRRLRPLVVPGNGEQAVRPMLIEDLAEAVAAVLSSPRDDDEILVEGPQEASLKGHLEALNGGKVNVRGTRSWLPAGLGVVGYAVLGASLMAVSALESEPVAALVVSLAGFALGMACFAGAGMILSARRVLPRGRMVLGGSAEELLPAGRPRPVTDPWSGDARAKESERRRADRTYRAQEASALTAVFFIVLGAAAVVIGVHDAVVVSTFGGRLAGTLLAVAGVVIAAGGASLFLLSWASRYVAAFVGGLVAALTLAVLVVAGVTGGDGPDALLLTSTLLLLAVLCCIQLARRGFPVVAGYMARKGFRTLGSLAVGGGALVVGGQFLFESLYVPSNATPTVTLDVSLTPGEPVGDMVPLTGTIRLKNPTDQSVNVLGSLYRVRTAKLIRVSPTEEAQAVSKPIERRWQRALRAKGRVRSYAREDLIGVVDRGRVVGLSTFLEPDEQVERRFVALARREDDLARLSVELAVSRRRFEGAAPKYLGFAQTDSTRVTYSVSTIDDESWIHRLTRSQRYVHVVSSFEALHLPECPGMFLTSYIDDSDQVDLEQPCSAGSRTTADYYGITFADASTEIQLRH